MVGTSHPRMDNVPFKQTLSPGNRSEMKANSFFAIDALQNIDREEELYITFDSE